MYTRGTAGKPATEARRILRVCSTTGNAVNTGQPSFDDFYPIDLEAIARLTGWRASEKVAMVGQTQGIELTDAKAEFDKKVITVRPAQKVPKGRINFSVAHEFGHIFLHGEKGVKTLFRIRPIREKRQKANHLQDIEIEADRFAAELLMPVKAVKYQFGRLLDALRSQSIRASPGKFITNNTLRGIRRLQPSGYLRDPLPLMNRNQKNHHW